MQTLPDYHVDALFRTAMDDEADAFALSAASESLTLERLERLLARRRQRQLTTLLLAAVLTTLAAGAIALGSNPTPRVTSESSMEASATPMASLPNLGLPGASRRGGGFVAGEFGWTGASGSMGGMHSVVEDPAAPDGFRQIQLTFAVEDDCFAYGADTAPRTVEVAGFDALYIEPYDAPDVLFTIPRGAATTRAYAVAIADRTLCLYLTWDPDSTQEELESARQVLQSIRAQPYGPDGIRINFTLPDGWDTG